MAYVAPLPKLRLGDKPVDRLTRYWASSNCSVRWVPQNSQANWNALCSACAGDAVAVVGWMMVTGWVWSKLMVAPPTKVMPSYWLKTAVPTARSSKSCKTGTPGAAVAVRTASPSSKQTRMDAHSTRPMRGALSERERDIVEIFLPGSWGAYFILGRVECMIVTLSVSAHKMEPPSSCDSNCKCRFPRIVSWLGVSSTRTVIAHTSGYGHCTLASKA